MQMKRLFEQVKNRQLLIELPDSFDNHYVEIIILAMDESIANYRQPHPEIIGKVKIHGDILQSVPISDWDLLQ